MNDNLKDISLRKLDNGEIIVVKKKKIKTVSKEDRKLINKINKKLKKRKK